MNDASKPDSRAAGAQETPSTPPGDFDADQARSTGNPMLDAALDYARRGWSVFPCEPGGKAPLTPHGFKNATTDQATIRAWWRRWPAANVAIRTGRESGLVVLDVDPRNGGDEALTLVEENLGRLPRTLVARTGGGGRHYYFKHPGDREIPGATNVGGLRGLDVKADGGYVIAPPSVHESGARYEWVRR